jgi:signal transduction histidine kinase
MHDHAARLLIVEDEHLVALDLQRRLQRMGHDTSVAYTGEEAVEQTATRSFDLILMDIKLSGHIDGIEAARTIRNAFDIPIVYVTAYADNRTIERARYTDPYGYIVKPFQERELKATIEMALQRHSTEKLRSQQQELQRFLADASTRMAMLDHQAVARATAELVVPRYADWCLIHLMERNETIPAFSFAHPASGGDPPRERTAGILERVERTARSELIPQDDGDVLCVPLTALNHVLGALVLVTSPSRTKYTVADLGFVEDLGQRLGMALENALLYRRAERAISMRDDVLAIVSHDLRTPLGTIMIQAESLDGDPGRHKTGESIVRAAQRMNRLIGDLLDASAINSGRLALELAVCPVAELVGDAVDPFRSQAEANSLELVEDIEDRSLAIRCDRDRMLQVLSNLIANAIKFTPESGTITVSVRRVDNAALFSVEDTGQGIAEEQIPHLFDRFWRGEGGGRQGAGLGLFITRGILAAHGAKIDVETELGVGSRFFFSLPIVEAS